MGLYPILLNIEERIVVIIGGGAIAYRKINDLLQTGAIIRIISPEIHKGIEELYKINFNRIEIVKRSYRHGDLEGAILVYSATNCRDINSKVFKEAESRKIFLNSVDDPSNCSFYVPSTMRRGDLILSISTSGASPAMAAKLRRLIEKDISDDIEDILESLKRIRVILKNNNSLNSSARGDILKKIVADDNLLSRMLESNQRDMIEEFTNDLVKIFK